MKFKDLYEKGLDRKVNPAVSASDLSDETVMTETIEYVFTEEIVINLYKILTNIKENQGSHVGIWINGYYGSGKSHFLKYTSYCLSKRYSDFAFTRLIEATEELMLKNKGGMSKLDDEGVSISNIKALQKWYVDRADIEMVLFNIGDVHDANSDRATTFTKVFWNQFNAQRGYNSFNLALAQYLEKALDEDGKYQEFKDYVKDKGYDWERNISKFAAGRLDLALRMAQEVDPALSIDVIRQRILNNEVNISVDAFAAELKEYLDSKNNRNSRVLFFVDEVSQFIGEHSDLILQLQSLVKRIDEVCESKVWIACTAQQTLDDVVTGAGGKVNDPNDAVGKILGRFEVRASLQGTKPEYITQKRILDKKGEVEIELTKLYDKDKAKLDAQFILPSQYKTYSGKDDFAAYYPFVPYQFQLIMKVLDSFVNMNFVDKQVKGNERSLLNITFSIAKETAECEVGEFVPFDRFFGAMFQGSMQHLGQRAMENARQALEALPDKNKTEFYRRVVYVLFMVCNLAEGDKQSFSATIDNIATLLMTKVDANRATIKNDISEVIDYLIDKSVIRKIKTETGSEIYDFYTEEESKVAQIIKNQKVDHNTYTEELYKLIYNHFGFSASTNRMTYCTRSFNVGGNVDGKHILSNNADVEVDFLTSTSSDTPDAYSFNNPKTHLVFFLSKQFKEDAELSRNFHYYCQVQRFIQEPAVSEERQRTKETFQKRAKEIYDKDIKPKFQTILDTCPVISGTHVLSSSEVGIAKKAERYNSLITRHIATNYDSAKLVDTKDIPRTAAELSSKILRPVDPTTVNFPLSPAEKKVKEYLDRTPHDVTAADVMHQFAKSPYGWSDLATIYILNELVRRHLYIFNYNNNPNVSREETARSIIKEASKFTVEEATAISQEVLNDFIDAWKHIFNVMTVTGSNDSTELYRNCKETEGSALNKLLKNYRDLSRKISSCPFAGTITEAIELMEKWLMIRDHKEFFETITEARESAGKLFDKCKSINTFANDQFDGYQNIKKFIDDNRDNFSFLSAEQQQGVEGLKAILTDETPWEHLPSYKKLQKQLNVQLMDCKKALIAKITENYNKTFDELDAYAKSVNVSPDKYAKRDITISLKTATSNFYALKDNANTRSFYDAELEKINAAIDKPQGPKPPVRKIVHLNTRTTTPMKTEADIDLYLQGLKAELMQYIDGEKEIIIS